LSVPVRVALDTNLLLYAEGLQRDVADAGKMVATEVLLDSLFESGTAIVLPAQVVCELHNALRRKLRIDGEEARKRVQRWLDYCEIAPTDSSAIGIAIALCSGHRLQTFDAIILSVAASANCSILYSEDMHSGYEWQGVRIINPFA
jgi:predicted nucleic acid-binding protein